MIKLTALLLILFTGVCAVVLFIKLGPAAANSCLLGGLIMLLNLLGFYYTWRLVFKKKSAFLAALIIGFKYILIGLLLWQMSLIEWLHPGGLIIGLSSLVIAILSMTAIPSFVRKST